MKKKRDLRQEKEILKPYLKDFVEKGIKVRIERGDFKSDFCKINGELVIFLNRKLTVDDQIKLIEDFKRDQKILEEVGEVVEREENGR